MVNMIKFTTERNKRNCTIVKRQDVIDRHFVGWADVDIIVLCIFLGCDYLPRIRGTGMKACQRLMVQWRQLHTMPEKQTFIGDMRTDIIDYSERFWHAFYFFQHAPIIRQASDYSPVLLAPLNDPIGYQMSDISIGFEAHELLQEYSMVDIYSMKIWARNGKLVSDLYLSQPMNSIGNKLPWGSIIDFDITPLRFQPLHHLRRWVNCRNRRVRKNVSADKLRRQVQKLIEDCAGHLDADSEIVEASEAGGGHYISFDTLYTAETVTWERNIDTIISRVKLEVNPNVSIDKINANPPTMQMRAGNILEGGHFDLTTLAITNCKIKEFGEEVNVLVVKVKCTPSMTSDLRLVVVALSVRDTNTGDQHYISSGSQCGCPKGISGREGACSHELALLGLLLYIIIHKENVANIDDLRSFCGNRLLDITAECIPMIFQMNY
jgi:hypothetical protein